MAFLYLKPPSSRNDDAKNAINMGCLAGNFKHNNLIASTNTTLKSSLISLINPVIDFIYYVGIGSESVAYGLRVCRVTNRSTLDSTPLLSNVDIANVAMERLLSVIKFSSGA
jgi:hypothetical protein